MTCLVQLISNSVDITLLIIVALPGLLSLLLNAINSRRAQLLGLKPKLNVEFFSKNEGHEIDHFLIVENLGSQELYLRSFRLYVYDTGFERELSFGPAVYSLKINK